MNKYIVAIDFSGGLDYLVTAEDVESAKHQAMMKWLEEGKDLYAMIPYLKAHMGHLHYSSTVYYIHLLPTRLLDSSNIDWQELDQIGKDVKIWEN